MLNLQHTQYAAKLTGLQDFSFHIDYIDLLFSKATMKKRNIVGIILFSPSIPSNVYFRRRNGELTTLKM